MQLCTFGVHTETHTLVGLLFLGCPGVFVGGPRCVLYHWAAYSTCLQREGKNPVLENSKLIDCTLNSFNYQRVTRLSVKRFWVCFSDASANDCSRLYSDDLLRKHKKIGSNISESTAFLEIKFPEMCISFPLKSCFSWNVEFHDMRPFTQFAPLHTISSSPWLLAS